MAAGNAPKIKILFAISQEVCRGVTCHRSPSRNTLQAAGGTKCPPQPGWLFAARSWIFFPAEMANLYYSPQMIHVPLGDPVGKCAPSARASRCAVSETVRIWLLMAGGSNLAKTGSVVGENVGYSMEMGHIMLLERELYIGVATFLNSQPAPIYSLPSC